MGTNGTFHEKEALKIIKIYCVVFKIRRAVLD